MTGRMMLWLQLAIAIALFQYPIAAIIIGSSVLLIPALLKAK